jgi:glycosyltransferase involved in cell wall biosynthesis
VRQTVCIDCRYLGPRPSGIAEAVQALVDFLPAMAPDLDFLLLRSPAHAGPLSGAANVREVVVPQAANGPATMWWLPRVVDLTGVNLFHATFNIMPARLAMPCVVTVHDLMWLTDPALCASGSVGWLKALFHAHGIRRALNQAAAIATVSEASRSAIRVAAPAAAERTFVTRSGVSPEFAPAPPDEAALGALGLRPDRPFVLTVGQYAPYKNHEGALRAFALAFADGPPVDLVLVQRRGSGAGELMRLAESLGVAERVHLLAPIGRPALVQLYSMAAALLHPSFCEGFGNPLAEAMACGCPVVTSDVSAMPEVTAGAALLAPPSDPSAIAAALRTVVRDPRQAGILRAAGTARAATLTWSAFATANLAVYRHLLARS